MRFIRSLPLMVACLLVSEHAFSHLVPAPDHEMVALTPKDYRLAMQTLNRMGVDVAGVDVHNGVIEVYVSPTELNLINKAIPGLSYELSGLDVFVSPDPEYYNGERVEARLRELASEFQDLATLIEIGQTVAGKSIWAMSVTNADYDDGMPKPVVLYNSMHHAREVMSTEVAMDTLEYLLLNYDTNDQVRQWVDQTEIWVIPMLNVDGNDIVWQRDRMWRKNARNGYGVDLNRNYPYNWNSCNGSSGFTWSQTYRGPSPASEPETQALMNLVSATRPVFNISYHSFSEMVLYPLGCRNQRTINSQVVEGIGREMAATMSSDLTQGRFYAAGTPWELLYSADGGDIDWMYGTYGTIPYVVELNSRREGFLPSYSRWRKPTVEKSRPAWQLLLDRLKGPGVRGFVTTSPGRSPEQLTIRVENLDKPHTSGYENLVNPDGSFHLILDPGVYMLTVGDGSNVLPPITVSVNDSRIDLPIEF